jgi:hypothetical protein
MSYSGVDSYLKDTFLFFTVTSRCEKHTQASENPVNYKTFLIYAVPYHIFRLKPRAITKAKGH